MNTLIQLSIAILSLFLVWRIYKTIKENPQLLSRENMSKSLTTMGLLALILIGGVWLLVMLVKSGR
ncbi:MAG: hypothetical protein ACHQJ6_00860 [Candidatus Berkiellales bacterium]